MKSAILKALVGGAMILAASSASAAPSLLGDTFALSVGSGDFAFTGGGSTVVTAGGPEYTVTFTGSSTLTIDIDINASSIDFTFTGTTGSMGAFQLMFSDLDYTPIASIVDVLFAGGSSVASAVNGTFQVTGFSGPGVFPGDISFEGNDAGDPEIGAVGAITVLHVDITSEAAAPEPGALALLGLGLAGLGFSRRRAVN